MRTLALLTALLLLAFQSRTEPLLETADQVPTQDQPEAEDQNVAISFTEEERVPREASGLERRSRCTCRPGRFCRVNESYAGRCTSFGNKYKLCCRDTL